VEASQKIQDELAKQGTQEENLKEQLKKLEEYTKAEKILWKTALDALEGKEKAIEKLRCVHQKVQLATIRLHQEADQTTEA
jgi:hypothetical protein